ncbi:hypothetical protein B0A48_12038 [Cryoendolithus antarcticus]|uniref:Fe2OG dioxygenase domain-containing protein n=1 Tax=Cryoendolithus antarcticus TaxID=1507870 RepID=A0A1V8SU06_9PEZI|nr:hypothetical protein B0A48_12038 [Cryoendolithus antarcticus]
MSPLSGSLEDHIQEQHVANLRSLISSRRSEVTFSCGGQLAVSESSGPCLGPSVPPVSLRFGQSGFGQTLQLPCVEDDPAKQSLLETCGVATFGLRGQDVLDETYRKALKLDTSDFCTDFCPYSCRIVAIIDQLLLPSYQEQRSVKAELYKLNMYGGGGPGTFKPHVDTPRGQDQIGSLVTGGDLSVRNAGRNMRFQWSHNSATSVQWAAFYSDCEHEVHEVTAGHRMTLTYNLYTTTKNDLQTNAAHSLNGAALPFHKQLRTAFADPYFLFEGGGVGVYLHHMYPHANEQYSKLLPYCLKGADMEVWEAVRALRVPVSVGTTLKTDQEDDVDERDDFEADSDNEETAASDTEQLYPLQTFKTYGETEQDDFKDLYSGEKAEVKKHRLVWLNEPGHGEVSAAFIVYGNEASLGVQYSHAALIIQVPSAEERHARGLIDDVTWVAKGASASKAAMRQEVERKAAPCLIRE